MSIAAACEAPERTPAASTHTCAAFNLRNNGGNIPAADAAALQADKSRMNKAATAGQDARFVRT